MPPECNLARVVFFSFLHMSRIPMPFASFFISHIINIQQLVNRDVCEGHLKAKDSHLSGVDVAAAANLFQRVIPQTGERDETHLYVSKRLREKTGGRRVLAERKVTRHGGLPARVQIPVARVRALTASCATHSLHSMRCSKIA